MKRYAITTLALLFIFALTWNSFSVDSLVLKAQSLIDLDRYEEAEKLLKAELKKTRDKIPVWLELGKLEASRLEWYDARGWFEKVEEQEPDNIEAIYYLGVCNREIGKFQATLFRILSLKASESYFKKVIVVDSLYKDVWYQYALLFHLKKDYTKAIETALHQLQLKPRLEDSWVGTFFLYRSYALHNNASTVEKWLAEDNSLLSQFFLADLYRQNGLYTQADSLYNRLSENDSASTFRTAIMLARVRSKIAQGKPLEGEMIYWDAVKSAKDSLQARWLFEDAKYILIDSELVAYRQCRPDDYSRFFTTLWRKRDPLPASPDNLRLIEHYRRLIYAEKEFRYDGYRTWNANPDQQGLLEFPKAFYLNRDLNDKGLIYIRHGEPDNKATALGEALRYNESWLYNERDGLPKLIFHFEIDEDGLAGDWRLTPMLHDDKAVEAVVMWDEAYARYLRGNETLKNQLANEIALANRDKVRIAMETDRHTWHRPVTNLPVSFSMANFKKSDKDLCELYVGFPVEAILGDTSKTKTVNMGMAVFDLAWNPVSRSDQYVSINPGDPQIYHGRFIRTYQLLLWPASYRFAFHADHLESPLLGGFRLSVTLPNFGGDHLICSDILLAHSMSLKDSTLEATKSNLNILPNPSRIFGVNEPLHSYLEIYNLKINTAGQSRYTVKYEVMDADKDRGGGFLGLFKKKPSTLISIESERSGTRPDEPEYTVLDISRISPGRKILRVTVKDVVGDSETQIQTSFEAKEE